MSNSKLLQLGLTRTGKQMVRTQYTCGGGIEPMPPPPPPPPPPRPKPMPQGLTRPPCDPQSVLGRFPPTCSEIKASYCPPAEKEKFEYPPFSENIQFVPGETGCWWLRKKECEFAVHSSSDDEVQLKP